MAEWDGRQFVEYHTHTIGPVETTLESGYFADQYVQRQAEGAGVPRWCRPRVESKKLGNDKVELMFTWTWATPVDPQP